MRKWNGTILAVALLIVVAIYSVLFNAPPLTWDDDSNIFANPYLILNHWWGAWNEPYFGLYVPVTSTVWAGLYYLGHAQAWPFRVLNVGLHLANTVLLFFILKALAERWKIKSNTAVGFAVAIFALHPLQVQTVAWISGGRDLLAAFFALATVAVYFSDRFKMKYFPATVLFLLALLSKPSVVVLPLVVGLIDIYMYGTPARKTWLKMAPWFALSLVVVMITHGAQVDYFTDNVETIHRPWIVLDIYSFYLQKIWWPSDLAANYGRTADVVISHIGSLFSAILVATMAMFALIYAYRHDKRYLVGILWFVLLLPVSGIVPFGYENISEVADHYNYLPLAVVSAVLLLAWERTWLAVPLFLIAGSAWASFAQVSVWKNPVSFFTEMSHTAPDSYNTAIGMSVIMCQDLKNYPAGVEWTDKALKAKPDDILALANRAYCLLQSGDIDGVAELHFIVQRLDVDYLTEKQPTGYSSLLASIGTALIRKGKLGGGFQYLCEAYRVKPSEPTHTHNLEEASKILIANGMEPVCDEDEE